jgi:glucan phosphorylase
LLRSSGIDRFKHELLPETVPITSKQAKTMFDPSALTIGFARRVAGYKRWNLDTD